MGFNRPLHLTLPAAWCQAACPSANVL